MAGVISQDYFDELCLENVEVFDLSEDEAVAETLQQLRQQEQNSSTTLDLSHLSQTFPTSARGQTERAVVHSLVQALQQAQDQLDNQESTATTTTDPWHEILRVLTNDNVDGNSNDDDNNNKSVPALYRSVLYVHQVMPLVLRALSQQLEHSTPRRSTLLTLVSVLVDNNNNKSRRGRDDPLVVAFQSYAAFHLDTWLAWLYRYQQQQQQQQETNPQSSAEESALSLLLSLLYTALRHGESNKKTFMACRLSIDATTTVTAAPVVAGLVRTAVQQTTTTNDVVVLSGTTLSCIRSLARVITTLCTFDGDTTTSTNNAFESSAAPTVASAHANVLTLHQEGLVVVPLLQLWSRLVDYSTAEETTSTTTNNCGASQVLVSVVLALRAMAIHDDTVQAMVAAGLLPRLQNTLRQLVQEMMDDETENNNNNSSNTTHDTTTTTDLLVATVGLMRNICANDEIKTTLCLGKTNDDQSQSVVLPLLYVMEKCVSTSPLLQEHACGTIAAMALRRPANARALIQAQAVPTIVRALTAHPQRPTLQRQGALAIRNLVARLDPDERPTIREQTAPVLHTVAAKHVSCQDAVYAALRDLGDTSVQILQVAPTETGHWKAQPTQAFGQGLNANFRPVYD